MPYARWQNAKKFIILKCRHTQSSACYSMTGSTIKVYTRYGSGTEETGNSAWGFKGSSSPLLLFANLYIKSTAFIQKDATDC